MLTTSTTYRVLTRDIDRTLARVAAEPSVARETDYYLAHIGEIKSAADFVKDTRLFNYAMTAFGLDDMAHAKAFMLKVLNEGASDPDAFANRLSDDRFVKFAETFDFAGKGEFATTFVSAQQGVVDRHIRQTLEVDAGADNEGVRLALYFAREAPNVASAYGVLADPALWQVVKTIFGFPSEMANADIDRQAEMVLQQLDIADLKDPAKLDQMIARFTATWDATEATQADPVLALFFNTSSASLDLELVMTLNNLRHGGV